MLYHDNYVVLTYHDFSIGTEDPPHTHTQWRTINSHSIIPPALEWYSSNRKVQAKLAVWLAIEERVFSVELHLCMKWYYWPESRAKVLKNVDAALSHFLFEFIEKFQSSLWIKFSTMIKHSSVTAGVLELSGAPTTYLDLDRLRLTLRLIC